VPSVSSGYVGSMSLPSRGAVEQPSRLPLGGPEDDDAAKARTVDLPGVAAERRDQIPAGPLAPTTCSVRGWSRWKLRIDQFGLTSRWLTAECDFPSLIEAAAPNQDRPPVARKGRHQSFRRSALALAPSQVGALTSSSHRKRGSGCRSLLEVRQRATIPRRGRPKVPGRLVRLAARATEFLNNTGRSRRGRPAETPSRHTEHSGNAPCALSVVTAGSIGFGARLFVCVCSFACH
jgi:hypothetical protein